MGHIYNLLYLYLICLWKAAYLFIECNIFLIECIFGNDIHVGVCATFKKGVIFWKISKFGVIFVKFFRYPDARASLERQKQNVVDGHFFLYAYNVFDEMSNTLSCLLCDSHFHTLFTHWVMIPFESFSLMFVLFLIRFCVDNMSYMICN